LIGFRGLYGILGLRVADASVGVPEREARRVEPLSSFQALNGHEVGAGHSSTQAKACATGHKTRAGHPSTQAEACATVLVS
jgi:hypothetical protein